VNAKRAAISTRDGITPENDQDITFYTIGDERFFLGIVGLINSLRLTGHRYKLVLLDCGLTQSQRDLLRPHCSMVERSRQLVSNPTMYKPYHYLLKPKGIVVIIDSDMIVTRSLEGILSLAKNGKICVFPDPENSRWFSDWDELFGLSNELRRQVYVNAGFLAFSTLYWPSLPERWWQCCEKIQSHPTIAEGVIDGPSAQADQDALNALLMSEFPQEALAIQPQDEEVFHRKNFSKVKVVDGKTLACSYRGHATTLLHSCGSPKPWEKRGWRTVRRNNAYLRLLHRLLVGKDLPINVPLDQLPLWLRPDIRGQLCMYGLDILNLIRDYRRRFLPRRSF
jgi:hypothetical protein